MVTENEERKIYTSSILYAEILIADTDNNNMLAGRIGKIYVPSSMGKSIPTPESQYRSWNL